MEDAERQLAQLERLVLTRREGIALRAREEMQRAREKALLCFAKCIPPEEAMIGASLDKKGWAAHSERACYDASPENYEVIAEHPTGQLIRMKLPKDTIDQPHGLPEHYMYVVSGTDNAPNKLRIAHPTNGGPTETQDFDELTSGAAQKMPSGPRQVHNIGKEPLEILLLLPSGAPAAAGVPLLASDRATCEVAWEDEQWLVGKTTLEARHAIPCGTGLCRSVMGTLGL